MSDRRKHDIKRTVLCATRFWSGDWRFGPAQSSVPTLRSGVRHVVRKQGFSTAAINKAERELIREGKLEASGKGVGAGLRLTAKGNRVSCSTVRLSPWTDAAHPGSKLAGGRRGKRRRR